MREFYEQYYAALANSAVYAEFCQRVYGRDMGQHGFSDVAQIDALIAAAGLRPGQRALDLGCGDGRIAEYISDTTGAHVTGLDYVPVAIEHAQARTAAKADRLAFVVGDINALALPDAAFDVILSIDTLYFSTDLTRTMGELARAVKPGGCTAIFYGYGREPWVPLEQFDALTVRPDCTPLADALRANGLAYTVQDFTSEELRLADLRRDVLEDLRPRFEAEGTLFLYESRIGDAHGIAAAIREGLHRRHLYRVMVGQGG